MNWDDVRRAYPAQWLVIEALAAHSVGEQRHLDQLAVVETCPDGSTAMQRYRDLHRQYPARDLYFVHTGREHLDIRERSWLGLRGRNEAYPQA